jgi:hypothetical protein
VKDLSELKGKRIAITAASGPTNTKILAAYGVNDQNTTFLTVTIPVATKALINGDVDASFFSEEVNGPSAQMLLRDPSIRLMNVAQAEAITQLFPSLIHLTLAQGVIDLEKNIPPTDVNMFALTNRLLVRESLHPEIVYLLAQTMKEEHSGGGIFHHAGEFPTQADPEFPMAEEAVDYYKNGPSFLQRYLPFWMISYAKRVAAILVTVIAIIIPIFSYAPRLYTWFLQVYTEKLYRRLRVIEASLRADLTFSEIDTLKSGLESISRAAHILPMRRSSLFFDLIMHIDHTRTRLTSCLASLRGQAA